MGNHFDPFAFGVYEPAAATQVYVQLIHWVLVGAIGIALVAGARRRGG